MHEVEIRREHLDHVARPGTVPIFAGFDPDSMALPVVDTQSAFIAPGGLAEVPLMRAIVPNINRSASSLRDAGGHIAPRSIAPAARRRRERPWTPFPTN